MVDTKVRSAAAGPSSSRGHGGTDSPRNFDVIGAYERAVQADHPHPIAAILALVEMMENSTAATMSGLATEVTLARQRLVETQTSLGVSAGCQLWGHFFSASAASDDFQGTKRNLISQGRAFCEVTALQCRTKIADLACGFLRDDCAILTHSYSRPVIEAIIRAHKVLRRRIRVYVTEARPACMGLKTFEALEKEGIPCIVVLDSAVAYVMDRVDMVLVGSEAVVESGGLVSSVGTYQLALMAKALQKPFYALAESYKFLRHYPLSQTDLPLPSRGEAPPLTFPNIFPPTAKLTASTATAGTDVSAHSRYQSGTTEVSQKGMTAEMERLNPTVDMTTPDLIDFIITDLGAPLSPTSVSQYIVAQFSS